MHVGNYKLLERFNRVFFVRRTLPVLSQAILVFALFLVPGHLFAQIEINETNFPDENFRNYLSAKLANNGTTIPAGTKVTSLLLDGLNITNLKGLELFPDLTTLSCNSNKSLTSIDLSGLSNLTTLQASNSGLTSLDFSNNPKMTTINCTGNQLTSINVKNCSELQTLSLGNNKLTELDVTNNPKLTSLSIYQNDLSAIDLSNNTNLTKLYAFGCTDLQNLDLSHNTKLTYLSVYDDKQMTGVDVSMLPDLQTFFCFSNKWKALDVTKNTNLVNLSCYGNNFTQLDLTNNTKLQSLVCFSNALTSLDLSHNTALKNVSCYSNKLTTLVLPTDLSLVALDCHGNKLTSLSIPTASASSLKFLCISNNAFSSMDLSSFPNLSDSYSDKIADMSQPFSNPSSANQKRSLRIYTDGNDAYLLAGGGIDASKITDGKINIGQTSTSITAFTLGNTQADGLVPLKFSNTTARQRLFNWSNSKATPVTITYNYNTGTTVSALQTMDVTDTVECYLLPMSQEYGSVYLPYDAVLPEGATAYAISAVNGEDGSNDQSVSLTQFATAGDIVKANTPMLIRRSDNTYSLFALNKSTGTAKAPDSNLLKGTQDAAIDNKDNYFVLGINNTAISGNRGKLGFWRSSLTKIGNWRAYLDMGTASRAKGFFFLLDSDTPTGLPRIENNEDSVQTPWYTLDGRAMGEQPSKGGVYIHNGKKIIISK